MSQPVSEGCWGKPPKRSLLPLLAAALVFFTLMIAVAVWAIHALISPSKPSVVLTTALGNLSPRAALIGPLLGGVVRNEQGEPIANAHVTITDQPTNQDLLRALAQRRMREIMAQNGAPPAPARPRNPFNIVLTTDAAGHFSTTDIPQDALDGLQINVSHTEYLPLNATPVPLKQLLDQTAVLVLTHGVDLNGVVVDNQANPLVGAQITARLVITGQILAAPPPSQRNFSALSSGDGKFALHHVPRDAILDITAALPGFGPMDQQVTLPTPRDLRFALSKSHEITGRVVDASGAVVPGASVRMLIVGGNGNIGQAETTDSNGEYRLRDAPAAALLVTASKQGYSGQSTQVDAAASSAGDLILRRPMTMRGSVTDAVTHLPVADFTIYSGGRLQPTVKPRFLNPRSFQNGHYDLALQGFNSDIDAWFVRVEAKGYAPAVSSPLHESGTVDFQLQPAKNLTGRLLGADGQPAPMLYIYLAAGGEQPNITRVDGHNLVAGLRPATPDSTGQFEFPPQSENFIILAMNDQGYALVNQDVFAKDPELKLSPWGRIEGRAMIGAKPAARRTISLNRSPLQVIAQAPGGPPIIQMLRTQTDDDGHFTFDKLLPRDFRISLTTDIPGQNGRMQSIPTILTAATVASGATAVVNLGGSGRPVTGRVILPDDLSTRRDWYAQASATSVLKPPQMPFPPDYQGMTPQEQASWRSNFLKTEPGKAFRVAQLEASINQYFYGIVVEPDGTFRIDDVLPGDYRISILLLPTTVGKSLANANAQFTMPPIDGGRSDEPMELPDIQMR